MMQLTEAYISQRLTQALDGVDPASDGYAEIEYRESDEQIGETIRGNDYEFDVNGKWI